MPRRARLILPDIPLHIIQRGNNRSVCFHAEEDFLFYLDWLARAAHDTGCAVHAYCLMSNHVHLLLTARAPDGAGALMKMLGQRYVQYVNRSYQRSGTLCEGRFRSCLLQEMALALGRVMRGQAGRPGSQSEESTGDLFPASASLMGPSWRCG